MAGSQPARDTLKDYLASISEYSTARIQFYYSSLPPKKHSNPTGYSAALNWWRRALVDLTEKGLLSDDHLVLHVDDELREKLRWEKVGRPTSLGVIIAELAQTSDLVPLTSFLSSPLPPASAGESSFSVVSLLARPFWWSLSKVWGSGGEAVDLGERADENEWNKRKGAWVIPDLVEKAAASLHPHLSTLHADALSRLYTLKTFREKLGGLCLTGIRLSEKDCEVLARYLEAKGECTFDGEVIKFSAPTSSSTKASLQITDSDRSILTLFSTLSSLSTYITSLQSRILAEQQLASKYAAGEAKNLALAKSHLLGRKRLEKLLEERVKARDRVQEVVWGIERAVGDEETLSALTLGTTALRSILASPTLQISNIEATTSALDDALLASQEVSEAVGAVNAPMNAEVEDEVEAELRAMQEEDRAAKAEKEGKAERERVEEAARKLEAVGKTPQEEVKEKTAEQDEKVVDKAEQLLA